MSQSWWLRGSNLTFGLKVVGVCFTMGLAGGVLIGLLTIAMMRP